MYQCRQGQDAESDHGCRSGALVGAEAGSGVFFSALIPYMVIEKRDVLSELMRYMDVLMSPEAG